MELENAHVHEVLAAREARSPARPAICGNCTELRGIMNKAFELARKQLSTRAKNGNSRNKPLSSCNNGEELKNGTNDQAANDVRDQRGREHDQPNQLQASNEHSIRLEFSRNPTWTRAKSEASRRIPSACFEWPPRQSPRARTSNKQTVEGEKYEALTNGNQ